MREGRRNPAIEDAIVKTAAAFLNTDGGTLLYDSSGNVVGEALAGNNRSRLDFTWVYYGPTGNEPKTIYFRALTIVGGHDSDLAPDDGGTYSMVEGASGGVGMH